MKKFILALTICFFPFEAYSSLLFDYDFVDALRAECGRVLYSLNEYEYTTAYENYKKRNSQYYALEQCLKVYKQNGGKMEDLNERYRIARKITYCDIELCISKSLNNNTEPKECDLNPYLFNKFMKEHYCMIYAEIKDKYLNCKSVEIEVLNKCRQISKDYTTETKPQQ